MRVDAIEEKNMTRALTIDQALWGLISAKDGTKEVWVSRSRNDNAQPALIVERDNVDGSAVVSSALPEDWEDFSENMDRPLAIGQEDTPPRDWVVFTRNGPPSPDGNYLMLAQHMKFPECDPMFGYLVESANESCTECGAPSIWYSLDNRGNRQHSWCDRCTKRESGVARRVGTLDWLIERLIEARRAGVPGTSPVMRRSVKAAGLTGRSLGDPVSEVLWNDGRDGIVANVFLG